MLPDRRGDKKNYDWWFCYVLACDELTGNVTFHDAVCDETLAG